jgi:excisionase family DNA binding protein
MPEYLTTRELAELLRLKERKIYDLAATGAVPCTKVHGKLLFPTQAVVAWLDHNSHGLDWPGSQRPPDVVLGSHDPLLEWALRESECGLATFFDGSADGLNRLMDNQGVATGLHLHEPNGWNKHTVAERCVAQPVVLLEWARRERGLLIRPELADQVRGLPDLRGLRVVPRQENAGAQALLVHLLAQAQIAVEELALTPAARSETDAAALVAEGKADAAFGLRVFASQLNLAFVPVTTERFDLLVNRRAWFEPGLQKLMAFCRGPRFAQRATEMPGYDISDFGMVHFNA